jgi:hypothetical protein
VRFIDKTELRVPVGKISRFFGVHHSRKTGAKNKDWILLYSPEAQGQRFCDFNARDAAGRRL